jgi:hypothetical protein
MMHATRRILVTCFSIVLFCAASALGAEWGTLKGKFLYDGKVPTAAKLAINKDIEVCSKHHPMDETLVVSEDGGLANVAVYIREMRGKKLEVHPDYEESAAAEVEMDNLHCRFAPHVATLRTSQTLILKNSDSVGHNTKADCFVNPPFNLLIPSAGSIDRKFFKGERLPVRVGCNIHPWMAGYLIVREDPYMTVSAKDGSFEIKNIPVGTHEFQLWQEKSGYLSDVKVQGKVAKKGRIELDIKPGVLDLGTIKVPAELFEK